MVAPPASEPVTLAEARAHLRMETTADDALIASQISEAREWVESQTHVLFITQTWDLFLDSWDGRSLSSFNSGGGQSGVTLYDHQLRTQQIRLPHGPVQSVQWVNYYDQSGNLQTWNPSNYIVSVGNPGRVAPRQNAWFPPAASQIDAVNVRYTAGYGLDGYSVPFRAKSTVKVVLERLYSYRGVSATQALAEHPIGLDQLLDSIGVGANLFA